MEEWMKGMKWFRYLYHDEGHWRDRKVWCMGLGTCMTPEMVVVKGMKDGRSQHKLVGGKMEGKLRYDRSSKTRNESRVPQRPSASHASSKAPRISRWSWMLQSVVQMEMNE